MTKRGIIRCILSILLLGYLIAALIYTAQLAAADRYKGLEIAIKDSESAGFVTQDDIDYELGGLRRKISRLPKDSINTLAIEKRILQMDNIEDANCVVLNNDMVRLDVTPLKPEARVFDLQRDTNYYINQAGKCMRASTRYRIDVPVITGYFNAKHTPADALPVIAFANASDKWRNFASSYHIDRKGDIIIIPMVKGHVVNFGDTADIANKFDRLSVFYNKVMPVKGWEYYDTLTVKWRGQVVAKRRHQKAPKVEEYDDADDFIDDLGTMGLDPQP